MASVSPDTASDSLLFGLDVALIVLIVIGTMFITSEYRRGLIRTTFAATPQRGRVLAAKAVVIGGVAFAVGAVASAAAIPLGEHVMRANGNYIFPADPLTIARVIVGSGAAGRAHRGRRARHRHDPAPERRRHPRRRGGVRPADVHRPRRPRPDAHPASAATWLYRVTPAAGFSMLGLLPRSGLVSYPYTMSNGYYPLPAWAGLLVLAGYAAAALVAALVVLRRRDA